MFSNKPSRLEKMTKFVIAFTSILLVILAGVFIAGAIILIINPQGIGEFFGKIVQGFMQYIK